MNFLKYFCAFLLIISPVSWGLPKITVTYNVTPTGFTQVRIRNETLESLACYVAIDGFKKKFKLYPKTSSQWITATDTRYNHQNFSTWCDYLDVHPKYESYREY